MDDRTAYEILKLKTNIDYNSLSRRYENFVRLYKRHMMRLPVNVRPYDLMQMKKAYEYLIYKRIEDNELQMLYPVEHQTAFGRFQKRIECRISPILSSYRKQILITLFAAVFTGFMLFVSNHRPVDLRVTVLGQQLETDNQYDNLKKSIKKLEAHSPQTTVSINRLELSYQVLSSQVYDSKGNLINYLLYSGYSDVYVMEAEILDYLKAGGVEFCEINSEAKPSVNEDQNLVLYGTFVDPESDLYKNICRVNGEQKSWVALIMPTAQNLRQSEEFVGLVAR